MINCQCASDLQVYTSLCHHASDDSSSFDRLQLIHSSYMPLILNTVIATKDDCNLLYSKIHFLLKAAEEVLILYFVLSDEIHVTSLALDKW
jgi:hypothetical protein